ncbi:hypothetical protein JMUB7518_27860 [Staphylococcus aureus]
MCIRDRVIGANGGVGSLLVQQLAKENVPFTAGVRQSDQLNALKSQGMKAILVDVENDSIETLTETFKPVSYTHLTLPTN